MVGWWRGPGWCSNLVKNGSSRLEPNTGRRTVSKAGLGLIETNVSIVETNQIVSSSLNVISTRQTCGQRSGMAAEGKRRALAFYFSHARHSHSARVHTESPPKTIFFLIFWVEPVQWYILLMYARTVALICFDDNFQFICCCVVLWCLDYFWPYSPSRGEQIHLDCHLDCHTKIQVEPVHLVPFFPFFFLVEQIMLFQQLFFQIRICYMLQMWE